MATRTESNQPILSSSSLMEQFPDILPDTNAMFKKWIWKEDTNTLEQVNGGISNEKQLIKKRRKSGKHNPIRIATWSAHRNGKAKKNDHNPTNPMSPDPNMKIHSSEKRSVTLDDVKSVSSKIFSDNSGNLSKVFQEILRNNRLDELLAAILHYFEYFFEKIKYETKPDTLDTGLSSAERKATLISAAKVESAMKRFSQKYCSLILGLDTPEHHHLVQGSQRKSSTQRDREFYETLYSYCCLVTWITFRRSHLHIIQDELGRLFRSDTFNPHHSHAKQNDFQPASDFIKSDTLDDVLFARTSVQKYKRPPISSIINQRSPVFVALLPTSKDSSARFLDRRNRMPVNFREEKLSEEISDNFDQQKIQVGIIGEMISNFNTFTLAPFGDDGYDDGDVDGSGLLAKNKEKQHREASCI